VCATYLLADLDVAVELLVVSSDGVEVIEKYRDRIRQLESDITAIEDAEREEKEMRVTELKANKAQNMLEHREEILSRPKRTWFQTHSERMQDIGKRVITDEKTKICNFCLSPQLLI